MKTTDQQPHQNKATSIGARFRAFIDRHELRQKFLVLIVFLIGALLAYITFFESSKI